VSCKGTFISGISSDRPSHSLLLPNSSHGEISKPNRSLDNPKTIVTVFAGVSLALVASGQNDIDHFPHRDDVQPVLSSVARSFYQFPKEILD
jgi:hypothetical protein